MTEPTPTRARDAFNDIPGAADLSRRTQARLLRRAASLRRFTEDDASACPERLRAGYSSLEWLALSASARRVYLLAVLVAQHHHER